MLFDFIFNILNDWCIEKDKVSLFEIINERYKLQSEIINELINTIHSVVGIGNSKTGWYKPNIKHINTSKNIKISNYRNYRLRNIARFPRETYYRIRSK